MFFLLLWPANLLNSVLSRKGAHFSTIDLKNFYLDTPMPDPEYVRIKISDIPDEFIEEYKLAGTDRDGWIYFEICRGCYGLPQAGILAKDLLRSCLITEGYYKAESTPGLWRHKWRPIQFCLIVDDFGVEYVGIEHFDHLLSILKKFHGVQFNMAGDKFAGINIKWDYANRNAVLDWKSVPTKRYELFIGRRSLRSIATVEVEVYQLHKMNDYLFLAD